MKMKKIVSAFSALAMTVTAMAGLAVTANAAEGDPQTFYAKESNTINSYGYGDYMGGASAKIPGQIMLNGDSVSSRRWGSDGIILFEQPSVPVGYAIDKVTLKLYLHSGAQNKTSDRALKVVGLPEYVDPMTASSANNNGTDCGTVIKNVLASRDYTNSGELWGTWDVTDYVETQLASEADVEFYLDAYFTGSATSAHGTTIYSAYAEADTYKPQLEVTYVEESRVPANITINYVTEEGGIPFKTDTDDTHYVGDLYTPDYDNTFDLDGIRYTYISGGEATTIENANTTIELLYSAADVPEAVVNITAKCGDSDVTIVSESMDEGTSYTYYLPKYVEASDGWYKYTESDRDFEISGTVAAGGTNIVKNYEKTDVTAFYEAEDLLPSKIYYQVASRMSGGAAVSAVSYTGEDSQIITPAELEAGIYTVVIGWRNSPSNRAFSVYNSGTTDQIYTSYLTDSYGGYVTETQIPNITIQDDGYIVVRGANGLDPGGQEVKTSTQEIDYIYVVKTDEIAPPEPTPATAEEVEVPGATGVKAFKTEATFSGSTSVTWNVTAMQDGSTINGDTTFTIPATEGQVAIGLIIDNVPENVTGMTATVSVN